MAIDATSSATAQSNAQSRVSLAENFDTFLTLLTAQLQNQDPLSPMDSNQFTQQLVQFSQVEQQIKTNEQLETMMEQSRAASAGTALSYLGRTAILDSKVTALKEGSATWSYGLPDAAASLKIEVRNAKGVTVYSTTSADRGQGSHLFQWDGKNNQGELQPEGAYQIVVTARDNDDKAITPVITTREPIIGIDLGSASPEVLTASGVYGLSDIRAILNN
jgi:flagellar basal-body rod modification protein FlgD